MTLEAEFGTPEARTFFDELGTSERSQLLHSFAFVREMMASRIEARQHFINVLGVGAKVTEPALFRRNKEHADPIRGAMDDEYVRGVLYGLEMALDLISMPQTQDQIEQNLRQE